MNKQESLEFQLAKTTIRKMGGIYKQCFPGLSQDEINDHIESATVVLVRGLLDASQIRLSGEMNEVIMNYKVTII